MSSRSTGGGDAAGRIDDDERERQWLLIHSTHEPILCLLFCRKGTRTRVDQCLHVQLENERRTCGSLWRPLCPVPVAHSPPHHTKLVLIHSVLFVMHTSFPATTGATWREVQRCILYSLPPVSRMPCTQSPTTCSQNERKRRVYD